MHVAYGLSIATAVYPFVAAERRRWLQRRWSRHLLDMLGLSLEISGPLLSSQGTAIQGLIVANHISWVDVFVISSLVPATFVCKSEVRGWPLIGSLCARTGTVFLERGSKFAAQRTHQALARRLGAGERVAIFPEGTTGEGRALLPFRAALLQSAIDAGTHIQPLAIRYLDAQGNHATAANYCGETSFWRSLRTVTAARGVTANITILAPVAAASKTRKELAEQAHALIRASLEQAAIRPGNVVDDETGSGEEEFNLAVECQAQ